MAIQGFDKTFYLNAKLEQLQNDPQTAADWAGKDADFLEARLQNGFGLTAEQHYEQYGFQEGLAPNAFFSPDEYIRAKATAMFNDSDSDYLTVDAAAEDFVSIWGGNVYEHYLQYGEDEGVNPSNDFDVSAYYEAKLAQLQAEGNTDITTVEGVKAAFEAAGITALEHFVEFGQDEGITAPAVPADEQVEVDDSVPGQTFMLTAGTDTKIGTADDDIFEAGLATAQDGAGLSEFQTLNNGDIIDGGAGNDRLNAVLNGTNPHPDTSKDKLIGIVQPEEISNVEDLYIQSRSVTNTLNLSNASGVEQLWNDNSTRDLVVNNLSDENVVLGLDSVRQGTQFDVEYAANAAPASQDVVLKGAGRAPTGGDDAVTLNVDNAAENASIADLNLDVASGVNNIIAAGALTDVENLTVAGAGDLYLSEGSQFAEIQTVAAADYEGDLNIDVSGQDTLDKDTSFVLGAGDNRLVVDGAQGIGGASETQGKGAVIDLGEGENVLAVGAQQEFDLTKADINYDSVQELEFGNSTTSAGTNINLEDWVAVDTLTFSGALNTTANTTGSDALVVADAPSELTVNFDGEVTGGGGIIDFHTTEALTINNTAKVENVTLGGKDLTSLDVNAAAEFGTSGSAVTLEEATANGETSSVENLTLSDVSEDGTSSFDIALKDTLDLTTINASNMQDGSSVVIDAAEANTNEALKNDVTVQIGKLGFKEDGTVADAAAASFTYDNAAEDAREVFQFTGDDIGNTLINGFEAGVTSNFDRLDFSQVDGVNSLDDISVVGYDSSIAGVNGVQDADSVSFATGDGFVITSDAFEGSIVMTGVQNDPTDDASNFIF